MILPGFHPASGNAHGMSGVERERERHPMRSGFRHLGLLATLPILAACQPASPPGPVECDLAQHQQLVGQNIGAVSLPASLPQRIISPGDMVTQDFNPARLNIFVDEKGWIGRVSCG